MSKIDLQEISPKVRKLVWYLNRLGFKTCDSGDGSNFENGMGCALPYPHVFVQFDAHDTYAISGLHHDLRRVTAEEFKLSVSYEVKGEEPCFVCVAHLLDEGLKLSKLDEYLFSAALLRSKRVKG